MLETFGKILALFGYLFVGLFLKRVGVLKQSDTGVINNLIIYATVPALAFSIFYGVQMTWAMFAVVGIGAVAIILNMLLARQVARAIHLTRPKTGAFLISSSFGNTTYLGLPVIAAAMNSDAQAMATALLFSEFTTALPVYTVGLMIASKYGGSHVHLREAFSVKRVPAVPAAILGIVLTGMHIYAPILEGIHRLGQCTLPLAMISISLMLSGRTVKGNSIALAMISLLKFITLPALMYGLLHLAGIGGVYRTAAVLQAAMPTSVIAGVITARGGSDGPLTASSTVMLTLVSMITIPLTLLLIR